MEITTFDHYQELAVRTAKHDLSEAEALATWALGLDGESGEVADLLKKHIWQGHPLNRTELIKELGDVLWYISAALNQIGYKFSDILSYQSSLFSIYEKIISRDIPGNHLENELAIACFAMRLNREASNFSEHIDDYLSCDKPLPKLRLMSIAESMLCWLTAIAQLNSITLQEIAETNIAKLKHLYPDGFDPERSINRVPDAVEYVNEIRAIASQCDAIQDAID